MPWQQITLRTHREALDDIETLLLDQGALSVTYRDAQDDPVLEPAPGETPLWDEVLITGLFEADTDLNRIHARLAERLSEATLQTLHIETLDDRDWERSCMQDFHPLRFGERLWICPSWERPPQENAVNILLDPGLAFGTGTHPTTALCLQWLDAHPPTGKIAIDYGCGSGILAIAALKLGARHLYGVDIDPQALTATRENAEKNGIGPDALDVLQPESMPTIQCDLLIANILSGPLVELAPSLEKLVKPGGELVLSGILQDQAESVREAYAPSFEMAAPVVVEGWVLLSGVKRC